MNNNCNSDWNYQDFQRVKLQWYFVKKIVLTYCKKCYLDPKEEEIILILYWSRESFENLRVNVGDLQTVWDNYDNLFKQWKTGAIFQTGYFFQLWLEVIGTKKWQFEQISRM